LKLQEKSNIIAAVGTIVFMLLLFLLLWFIYLNAPHEEEDEGIMVSFGEVMEEGGGLPNAAPYQPAVTEETAAPAVSAPASESLLTQEDEAAMQAAKEQQKREAAEAKRQEELRKAEEARKQAEQRKQNEAIAKAQQMGSLFGNTNSAEGANGQVGDNGTANNGNPLGHGSAGGNSWSLNGRYLVGSLPSPSADFKQEGKVVVNIVVDKNGKVVQARPGQGTTISDEATRQLAVKAAMKAQFNMVDHPNAVMGTITYYFKFK